MIPSEQETRCFQILKFSGPWSSFFNCQHNLRSLKSSYTMLDFLSTWYSGRHNALLCKFRTEFSFCAIIFKFTHWIPF